MTGQDVEGLNRRGFLQASAAVAAGTVGAQLQAAPVQQKDADKKEGKPVLPTKPLGKTGVDVTILNMGTWRNTGTNRLLRFAYANGVRVFDTADCYGSEPAIKDWLRAVPEVRKNIFLVTKDHPKNSPSQLIEMLDKRLDALGTDYVDLFLIHGIGPGEYGPQSLDWPKSKELKDVAEKIRKSGKAKLVGFSCHDREKAKYIQAAADGGFLDAVMLQYSPWIEKDDPLNRALDACHKKGIGLISMKQIAGTPAEITKQIKQRVPSLLERGLNAYQSLLHAIWTDERFAMSCVSLRNIEHISENADAARKFEPLAHAELQLLHEALLASRPTMCHNCDGRCARAAGTNAALNDVTRLLTYHDQYGERREARRLFAEMAEDAKDWTNADLAAAQSACHSNLDFAALLGRAQKVLA